MIRIAFLLSLTDQWAGGVSYYENLFKAIRSAAPKQVVVLIGVLTGKSNHARVLSLLDEVHEVPSPDFREKMMIKVSDWMRPHLSLRRFMPQLAQSRILRKVNADVVFSTTIPGYCGKTPVISWVPDFQFKHMPEMFTTAHKKWLEGNVRELAFYSSAIILSSHAALKDFTEIVPEYSQKARIVQFVSGIGASVYEKNPQWVCDEYKLPERFFYLPNQFWKHKNHTLVLDALKIACHSMPDLRVVATGLLNDHRHLTYPSELVATISQKKLRENFILLGYIPRSYLYALVRQSIAVLQPSLFEGWSTSVEEAKSIGKQILMSDIPVHREQDPPRGQYFPVHDANALARLMEEVWKDAVPGPDFELERQAREQFPIRLKGFGENFLAVVREIL